MSKECKKGDRISSLPESLLHHILSFLGIKDVARTSVLSKRWNYIWTTVPTLDFRRYDFGCTPSSFETHMFKDFVDGTLRRYSSSNLDKFVLRWCVALNDSRLHSWISTVIRGNVKELMLDLWQDDPLIIPPCLFTCESMISLYLNTRPGIFVPGCISFPRLKRLYLYRFKFTEDHWNEELFSNCPVLEELELGCSAVSINLLRILVPTLKLLKIYAWNVEGNGLRDCVLKIDAPRLVTFSYQGYAAKEFILPSFLALEKATVKCTVEENDGAVISQLLRALAHAKRLTVYNDTLEAICFVSNNLLTFRNVKMLKICNWLTTHEQGLIALLKAVPNLESLVFGEFSVVDDEEVEDHDDSWAHNILPNEFLFPHLKSVCFRIYSGNPIEMRWVKLILSKAKALQTMTIRFCSSSFANAKSEEDVMVEIPNFPRASACCMFKFCSRRRLTIPK